MEEKKLPRHSSGHYSQPILDFTSAGSISELICQPALPFLRRIKKAGGRRLSLLTTDGLHAIGNQHISNMPNGSGGIESLWTNINAVLDAVATEDAERVVQLG